MQYKKQTFKIATSNREVTILQLYALTKRNMRLLPKVFRKALHGPDDPYIHVSNDNLAYHRDYFANCALLQVTIKKVKVSFFFNSEWTDPDATKTYLKTHDLKTLLGRAFLIAFEGEAISPFNKRGELLKEATSKDVTPNIYALVYEPTGPKRATSTTNKGEITVVCNLF